MPAHKRTKAQRDKQILEMFKMWVRGATQGEIAKHFGVHQTQVSHDLKELCDADILDRKEEVKRLRSERLMELSLVKQEFWQQWDKSKLDKEVQTQEKITNTDGENSNKSGGSERIKAALRTEGQCGDPAFLDGIRKVIQEECKIAGLYAPKQLEHSGKDGEPMPIQIIEVVRPAPKVEPIDSRPPSDGSRQPADAPLQAADSHPPTPAEQPVPPPEFPGMIEIEVVLAEKPEDKLKRSLAEFSEECSRQDFKKAPEGYLNL